MFTSKHFVSLATVLRDGKPAEPKAYWQWRLTVGALAQLFARNNPRFDIERFFAACGIPADIEA